MFEWFYSDPHFGHSRIIEMCGRPFSSVEQMNEELVRRYNERVEPGDPVLWLGDCFFMGFEESKGIFLKMHGPKFLIRGNHDRSDRRMAEMGFDWVSDEIVMDFAGVPVRANHYPYRNSSHKDDRPQDKWPRKREGEILLHGHTHGRMKRLGPMIHCGVDAWDYAPVSRSGVLALIGETGL